MMDVSTDFGNDSMVYVSNRPEEACFQFQNERDGTLLTICHTVEEGSKIIRVRFMECFFSSTNRYLVLLDHRYHIFIFDLTRRKFWKLSESIPYCCVVVNNPRIPLEYVAGTKDGKIVLFDIKKSAATKRHSVSNYPVLGLSFFSTLDGQDTLLAYTANELILLCPKTMVTKRKWKYNEIKISIKYASSIPKTNKFFACFSNDIIHIWSELSHDPQRVVNPIRLRSHYKQEDIIKASLPYREFDRTGDDPLDFTCDPSNGVIRHHKLSVDGKTLCMSTNDGDLILLSTSDFEIMKMVRLTNVICKRADILPHSSNSFFHALTSGKDLILVNCRKTDANVMIQASNVHRISLSPNGELIGIVLKTGEVKLCRTSVGCSLLSQTENAIPETKQKSKKRSESGSSSFDNELQQLLPKNRLALILQEYGEYPEKHRHLIWCSLLHLPNNRKPFLELLRRGLHPAVEQFNKIYPLKDAAVLRNLKRTVSCLIHWCNAFAYCRFLPNFVFPFLKIFPNSPMLTFELVITILQNHCQLWFEFSPMEPLNYLGMVENILNEFCPKLVEFYKAHDISANIYAWPLLSTAFSEVLDTQQWFKLWDNIVSNQSEFLVFCVVAYNILLKSTIRSLKTAQSIQSFFRDQNIVDIKRLIKCASVLMKSCPEGLHPQRYMHVFEKLPLGYYPKFENYPKEVVNTKVKEIDAIRQESAALDRELEKMAKTESELVKQLETKLKDDAHRKRLKDVENLYSDAISREIERIRYQEKMLLLYKRQMRNQEVKVTELINQNTFKNDVDSRMEELDSLMNRIEKNRAHQEMQLLFADDELHEDKLRYTLEQSQAHLKSRDKESLETRYKCAINKLADTESALTSQVNNLSRKQLHKSSDKRNHSVGVVHSIKSDLKHIEAELMRTIQSSHI